MANAVKEQIIENTPGLDAYRAFVEKHWQAGPTALQYVISAHLFAENTIDERLTELFPHDDAITRLGFANKLILLKSAGFPESAHTRLVKLNSLRNKYAHDLDYHVRWEDVRMMRDTQNHSKKEWDDDTLAMLRRILSYTLGYTHGHMRVFTLES